MEPQPNRRFRESNSMDKSLWSRARPITLVHVRLKKKHGQFFEASPRVPLEPSTVYLGVLTHHPEERKQIHQLYDAEEGMIRTLL